MALRPEPVTGGQSTQEGNLMTVTIFPGILDPAALQNHRVLPIKVDADSFLHLFIGQQQAAELVERIYNTFPELKKENHERRS